MSTPMNAIPTSADLEKRADSEKHADLEKRHKEWSQVEYTKAMRHLANQGYGETHLLQPTSRVLPPHVALWHFEVKQDGRKSRLWVVTGADLPVDHVAESAAANARDALRHFYLHWQLKAAQLGQSLAANQIDVGNPALQTEYIRSLESGSERLFQVVNEERLWPEFKKV